MFDSNQGDGKRRLKKVASASTIFWLSIWIGIVGKLNVGRVTVGRVAVGRVTVGRVTVRRGVVRKVTLRVDWLGNRTFSASVTRIISPANACSGRLALSPAKCKPTALPLSWSTHTEPESPPLLISTSPAPGWKRYLHLDTVNETFSVASAAPAFPNAHSQSRLGHIYDGSPFQSL